MNLNQREESIDIERLELRNESQSAAFCIVLSVYQEITSDNNLKHKNDLKFDHVYDEIALCIDFIIAVKTVTHVSADECHSMLIK